MRNAMLSAALLLCLVPGCVKKSTYEALKAQKNETDVELGEARQVLAQRTQSLEQALADEREKSERQRARIAELEKELEAAQARQVQLQDDLTRMVRDASKLKSSVADMQQALSQLEAQRKQTQARVDEFKRLLASFKTLIDAGKLRVKVVAGRMVVELPSDILFASGSVTLSQEGMASLNEVGSVLKQMKDKKFQVEGHTDDQPIRTTRFPNNWALAAGRASAVAEILIQAGVRPENISAASYGEFRPVVSNASSEGRRQNRRIEIALVPDLSKVPGFEELEKAVR
jgi:chemotaxis protein MotB